MVGWGTLKYITGNDGQRILEDQNPNFHRNQEQAERWLEDPWYSKRCLGPSQPQHRDIHVGQEVIC